MDLQEDLVRQKAVAPTTRRICPVVHTVLQFAVDAEEEGSKAEDKVKMTESGSSSPVHFRVSVCWLFPYRLVCLFVLLLLVSTLVCLPSNKPLVQ